MGYNAYKSVWLNPNIEYIFDQEIIEYDMKDAGFNLIKQYGLLPKPLISELEKAEKGLERHIMIGKLQRDNKELSKQLNEKFAEMRAIFISTNNLSDNDIISVKKDAIYTIGQCNHHKFGTIEFAPKNQYTSYIRFSKVNNLEIYYSYSQVDIKGMSDSSVNRHRLYMLQFIRSIIRMIESKDSSIKRFIVNFIDRYKGNELDEEYYIEFNNLSRDLNPMFNYMNIIIPLLQIIMKEIQ